MSRKTKGWLVIAASLVLVGCIAFGGVMTVLKWDLTKLSTTNYETNEYELYEAYQNISIVTNTADVVLVSCEGPASSVVCYEQKNVTHSVTVKDDTLVIQVRDTRKWYEHIGLSFGNPKITVSLPQGEYGTLSITSDTGDVEVPGDFTFERMDISEHTGDVTSFASASEEIKITTSTGAIRVEGVSAGAMDLSVSTGNVTVSGVTCRGDVGIHVSTGRTRVTDTACKRVVSKGSTGDVTLTNVIAAEQCFIERSTGDVRFEGSDAPEILVKTDTGDVTGTLLTDKVFIVQTDTGRVDVPKTTTGGRCEITTDTGDIRIHVQP